MMQIDEKKLKKMVKKLSRPRTVDELAELVGISRRTVFRWLSVLDDQGVRVYRANLGRPTKYQIAS